METGLQNAGFTSQPTLSPGMQHTLPDGTTVRIVDANGPSVERAVFQNANGQPANPLTNAPPQPPNPKPANCTQQARAQTHIELGP